jgi:hypothetical protein
VPYDTILLDIAVEEDGKADDDKTKLAIAGKQDLLNRSQALGIGQEYKRHEDDAESVRLSVEQDALKGPNKRVFLYEHGEVLLPARKRVAGNEKRQRFVLGVADPGARSLLSRDDLTVCIDDTHGMGVYEDVMHLTTVIVPDENMEGRPVAYILSTDKDQATLVQVGFTNCKRLFISLEIF